MIISLAMVLGRRWTLYICICAENYSVTCYNDDTRVPEHKKKNKKTRKEKLIWSNDFGKCFGGAIVVMYSLVVQPNPNVSATAAATNNPVGPWPNAGHLFQLAQVPPIRFQGAFIDISITYVYYIFMCVCVCVCVRLCARVCVYNASLARVYTRTFIILYTSRPTRRVKIMKNIRQGWLIISGFMSG